MAAAMQTETIGRYVLFLVRHPSAGIDCPITYSIERVAMRADGSCTLPVRYGSRGFETPEEALAFGREWCEATPIEAAFEC